MCILAGLGSLQCWCGSYHRDTWIHSLQVEPLQEQARTFYCAIIDAIFGQGMCVCVIVSVLGRREVIQILKDVITDSLKDQGKEDSVHRMGLQFLFMVHQFLLAGVEPWVIMNNMLMHQAHSQTLVSPCLVKQGLALALYIFVTGL